jgi:predicted glycosyltransferase involved in capsule biosynthesis
LISICIPIHNYNAVKLINSIYRQAEKIKLPFEIIAIDDGSEDEFIKLNSSISNLKNVQFISLKKNIGRSKIRNLFLDKTNFESLLFIDCDCSISSENFLKNYQKKLNNDVVYGGRKHHPIPPKDENLKLRWLYGIKIEDQTLDYRINNPYHSFKSNNFLIKKNILSNNKFDETFTGYGHEDTLLSLELKKDNLCKLEKKMKALNGVKLITYYKFLRKIKMDKLLLFIAPSTIRLIELQLLSRSPSLWLFNLYKLLIYIRKKA